MSNETFVFHPPASSSENNVEKRFDEIADMIRGLAVTMSDMNSKLENLEVRLEIVEQIRSQRSSKASTPRRSPSPITFIEQKPDDELPAVDINYGNVYRSPPPSDFAGVETLLKLSGNFSSPKKNKDGNDNNKKKNNNNNIPPPQNNKNNNSGPPPVAAINKKQKKKEANIKNTRKSISEYDELAKDYLKNNEDLKSAVPVAQVKSIPDFKERLYKTDLTPSAYREFCKKVVNYQNINGTTLPIGSYVADDLIQLIIDKNVVAKYDNNSFVEEIKNEAAVRKCSLEQLTTLIRVVVAPKDMTEYEEKLKEYLGSGVTLSRNNYHPRIHDFQAFSDSFRKFLDKFADSVAFLSGSKFVLPMVSKKDIDNVDGSVQILMSLLPKNYGKYLRQLMKDIPEEDDDILSFLNRVREAHMDYGYRLSEGVRAISKALLKDYPHSFFKEKEVGITKKQFPQKNSVPTTIYKDKNQKTLQTIVEEEEISNQDLIYQQEAFLDQLREQELEEETDFDSHFHSLTTPGVKPINSSNGGFFKKQDNIKPTLYDSKSGKTYAPKGCKNSIIYDSCYLEKQGSCKDLHDPKSIYETALLIQERTQKVISDYRKQHPGLNNSFPGKKPSLNTIDNNDKLMENDGDDYTRE